MSWDSARFWCSSYVRASRWYCWGVVVSLISNSPLGVSGPGAGLAVIVLMSIQKLQSFEIFLFAVFLAGIIQISMGLLKIGIVQHYFSSAVIRGMLAGIGLVIMLKQLPHMVGYDKDPEGDFSFMQVDGHNTLSELSYMLGNIGLGATIIAFVSLFIIIFWEKFKKNGVL